MTLEEQIAQLRAQMESRKSGYSSTQTQAYAPQAPVGPTADKDFADEPTEEAITMASAVRTSYEDLSNEDPYEEHWGILFTDTNFLAQKYQCDQQRVYDLFNRFIQAAYDQKMYWYFLDAVNYYSQLGEQPTWADYNKVVDQFIQENQLQPSINLQMMIVGGADVIPIPHVRDPYAHGNGSVPSDMCYAFSGTFLADFVDGQITNLDKHNVRCAVARLPLEDGVMNTEIEGDLGGYFHICSMYGGGIPVGNVVMSSNADWIPASSTMSQHLPLLFETEDPELVRNGMYISPELLTDNDDAMDIYCKSLQEADLLMFNLHGADHPQMPGFYSTDEAFNPGLLYETNARVFNTVACFGARYSGYERGQSMVLSALYGGGVLLYTGSLVPVPMYYDAATNEARELLLNPGTGSEVFMRLYTLYQFKGMMAGTALMQAKLDYFNLCRHVESDGFTLSTVMMFSLYGNPMLHVRKRAHVIESALENDAMPPAPVKSCGMPVLQTTKRTLMSKSEQKQSLLQQIQGAVDNNLASIRQMAEDHLYRTLGLPPRMLSSIEQIERQNADGSVTSGYSFNYHNDEAYISPDYYCEVDEKGLLTRMYTTK